MRDDLEDPVHEQGAAPRDLLVVPPLLHGPSEAAGHGGRIERFKRKYGAQTVADRQAQAKAAKPAAGKPAAAR